jgi:three-Cys-motif partner protein
MPLKVEHYEGREQSYIKHLFLQKYLENAAYKLFQGRSPVFNFVDAFAGPWRNTDTISQSDTSFALALTTLENVRRILEGIGRRDLKVRFRFCERSPASFARLQAFAAENSNFDIKVFAGAFEDNLGPIEAACRDMSGSFTFTFIDPTGWDVDSSPIFAFLKALRGEVLFNFMSEHVNRHAGWEGVAASVGRFLADPGWRSAYEALPDGPNEEKILKLLKSKMKEAGAATWLPDFAIRKPRENRIKMRLILGTHSAHGVEVFRTVQGMVEKEGFRVRQNIKTNESRQPSLSDELFIELDASREGVGSPATVGWGTETLLQAVSARPGIVFERLAAGVMEQVPLRMPHLNRIVIEQRKAGLLRFDLPGGKRTPSPETKIWPNDNVDGKPR